MGHILSEGKVNNYKSVSLYIDSPERRNQIISSENFYDGNQSSEGQVSSESELDIQVYAKPVKLSQLIKQEEPAEQDSQEEELIQFVPNDKTPSKMNKYLSYAPQSSSGKKTQIMKASSVEDL